MIVRVGLDRDRGYDIDIRPGALSMVGELTARACGRTVRTLLIADTTVARHYAERVGASLSAAGIAFELVTFPPGEPSKSMANAERLWKACADASIDRSGAIIALGGGVCGDLAGFVAACWMRGVRFIQVPTTLLAMVDSSVGGKTGVNSIAGKNLIGAFHQPRLVVIDPEVLASMDARDYRAGLAEVLKYGVIRDAGFLDWQETHAAALVRREADAVAHAVAACCRIKAAYVVEDETETGVRAQLNYGHTFGHALERDTGYRAYLHGEAVGIGMRMAADLAQRLGLLTDPALAGRQDALLSAYGLPLIHRAPPDDAARLAAHCRLDKKNAFGRCRFVLPRGIGQVETATVDDMAPVVAAFRSAMG